VKWYNERVIEFWRTINRILSSKIRVGKMTLMISQMMVGYVAKMRNQTVAELSKCWNTIGVAGKDPLRTDRQPMTISFHDIARVVSWVYKLSDQITDDQKVLAAKLLVGFECVSCYGIREPVNVGGVDIKLHDVGTLDKVWGVTNTPRESAYVEVYDVTVRGIHWHSGGHRAHRIEVHDAVAEYLEDHDFGLFWRPSWSQREHLSYFAIPMTPPKQKLTIGACYVIDVSPLTMMLANEVCNAIYSIVTANKAGAAKVFTLPTRCPLPLDAVLYHIRKLPKSESELARRCMETILYISYDWSVPCKFFDTEDLIINVTFDSLWTNWLSHYHLLCADAVRMTIVRQSCLKGEAARVPVSPQMMESICASEFSPMANEFEVVYAADFSKFDNHVGWDLEWSPWMDSLVYQFEPKWQKVIKKLYRSAQ
jgi:hypothetical protein